MADDLRHRYAEAIRTAADFSIVGEWICCEPVNPEHDLCVKGDIARQMLAAVLADDCETLFVPSKLVDAVKAVRDEELQALRERAEKAEKERAQWRQRATEAEKQFGAQALLQRDEWMQRAEHAEAAIARVRAQAMEWVELAERGDACAERVDLAIADCGRDVLAALDDTKEETP
ncbi:hypothetical protein ABT294_00685 [Nonomuraea sp. NPDC000554]|uniref:hypothetical protein n=1 Tax=Nonomuraea sp. NPDC000554 TaxID=3154259 RepID=UPI00332230F1